MIVSTSAVVFSFANKDALWQDSTVKKNVPIPVNALFINVEMISPVNNNALEPQVRVKNYMSVVYTMSVRHLKEKTNHSSLSNAQQHCKPEVSCVWCCSENCYSLNFKFTVTIHHDYTIYILNKSTTIAIKKENSSRSIRKL